MGESEREPVRMCANVQNKSVNNDIRSICTSMGMCVSVSVCMCQLMSSSKVCMMRFTVVWATAKAAAAKAIAHEMNIKNDTYGTVETFTCIHTKRSNRRGTIKQRQKKRTWRRRRGGRRGSNRSRNCVMFCLFAVVMREIHVFRVCVSAWVCVCLWVCALSRVLCNAIHQRIYYNKKATHKNSSALHLYCTYGFVKFFSHLPRSIHFCLEWQINMKRFLFHFIEHAKHIHCKDESKKREAKIVVMLYIRLKLNKTLIFWTHKRADCRFICLDDGVQSCH